MTEEEALYQAEDEAIASVSEEARTRIKELVESGKFFIEDAVDIVLAVSQDPSNVTALEIISKRTQAEAIDRYIEAMHPTLRGLALAPGVPALAGNRGTANERHKAVISHFQSKVSRANDNKPAANSAG